MIELKQKIAQEKPLIVALCEVKRKNTKEMTSTEYEIPNFVMHHVNIDQSAGRGIIIYCHQ